MKQPRFIREYANWRIRQIQMESDGGKDHRIERIHKAVRHNANGLLTVDEAMRIILRA